VLGHSEAELQRLTFQAALIEPITRQLLVDAGVREGMRVLDVGTGRGDVAFLAAELVGESGFVLGIDRAPPAIAIARERGIGASGAVSFEVGDPVEFGFESEFDAIVGRYVLQFLRDPVLVLRRLAASVRSGGVLAFHEIDWTGHRSVPPVALWDRCCRLVTDTIAAGGARLDMGTQLASVFAHAGLPAPAMRMTSVVGAGANSSDAVQRLSGLMRSLLPAMEENGLVSPGEFDEETLAQRLGDEVDSSGSFVVAGSEVTAFSHLPGRR
jgi:SAM-dependent methyltransferase